MLRDNASTSALCAPISHTSSGQSAFSLPARYLVVDKTMARIIHAGFDFALAWRAMGLKGAQYLVHGGSGAALAVRAAGKPRDAWKRIGIELGERGSVKRTMANVWKASRGAA